MNEDTEKKPVAMPNSDTASLDIAQPVTIEQPQIFNGGLSLKVSSSDEKKLESDIPFSSVSGDSSSKGILFDITDKFEKKINRDRSSLLTIFGVFASIVIFLSVDTQILKDICNYDRFLGISLIILGSFLCFIFLLQYITKSWIENNEIFRFKNLFTKEWWREIGINISVIITIIALAVLFYSGYSLIANSSSEVICRADEIKNEVIKSVNKDLNALNERNKLLEDRVGQLESNQIKK